MTRVVLDVGLRVFGIEAAALRVKSREPIEVAQFNLRTSPGLTPCMRKGRRTLSPAVRRYGRPWM